MDRRTFIRTTVGSSAAAGAVAALAEAALAGPAHPGPGPYGPLGAANVDGVLLPEGFTARIVAVSGAPVGLVHADPSLLHVWHAFPDGGACYPTGDGGWIYVSNSEVPGPLGGVGALKFGPDATVVDAYSILTGSSSNCGGGPSPWGTWLSGEETDAGVVWECDPTQPGEGIARGAMGVFQHEAVAVDPVNQQLYLTEDNGPSGFYRFTPTDYPDLAAGVLEIAVCETEAGGATTWVEVPDPTGASGRTSEQVPGANIFIGGEGCWYDSGFVYHSTKGDNKIWAYDIAKEQMLILYDVNDHANSPLVPAQPGGTVVDNVTVSTSGDVLVAEDGGNLEICIIAGDTREVAPIMRLEGNQHSGSEICGPAFSPDGSRLYFSSQRSNPTPGIGLPEGAPGSGLGVTYEVTGPFRTNRVGIAAVGPTGVPETMDPVEQTTTTTSTPVPEPSDQHPDSQLPATGGAGPGAIGVGMLAVASLLRLRQRQAHVSATASSGAGVGESTNTSIAVTSER